MSSMSVVLTNIDTYVQMKNDNIPEKNHEIKSIADSIMKGVNEIYANKKVLNPKQVALLGVMLSKLHQIKNEYKENEEVHKLYETIFTNLSQDIRFKNDLNQNIALASNIFEKLLSIVETDVSEEVIGQERPEGGLIRQISRTIDDRDHADADQVARLADKIYPIVILAATMDPRANVPDEKNEKSALHQDIQTFLKECDSQFGPNKARNELLETKDFFKSCLKTVWQHKRSE